MEKRCKYQLILLLFITINIGCSVINDKKVVCLTNKIADFELLIRDSVAISYVPSGIGNSLMYEYSVSRHNNELLLNVKDKKNKSHIILPHCSNETSSNDTLTLSIIDISDFPYNNSYPIFEMYLNNRKFTTKEGGMFKIKKSEIPYNKNVVKVHFFDMGIFETTVNIKNNSYSFFCHRSDLQIEEFEKIKVINNTIYTLNEKGFFEKKFKIKKDKNCLLFDILQNYLKSTEK
ncbi:hypothetical protein WAF17_22370 (plasmid) [Bernardetia sp. ABR2-2B]|uniref:hypothetical protein n=1 Tax=Bernardetia sp. ABR2-2B TaxID=3127472 RepID=UPI0030CF3D26